MIYWMTGLSGSGKTTLAKATNLINLDGDEIRGTVNIDLGFSMDDRRENNRRIAEFAKIIHKNGRDVIVSTISPTEEIRNEAKDIIGVHNFKLIYIDTSLEVCIDRDVKGLYKEKMNEMTGVGSNFEPPSSPDFIIHTNTSIDECVKFLKLIVCKA